MPEPIIVLGYLSAYLLAGSLLLWIFVGEGKWSSRLLFWVSLGSLLKVVEIFLRADSYISPKLHVINIILYLTLGLFSLVIFYKHRLYYHFCIDTRNQTYFIHPSKEKELQVTNQEIYVIRSFWKKLYYRLSNKWEKEK